MKTQTDILSREGLRSALERLSRRDYKYLQLMARHFGYGLSLEPQDLVHMAVVATLSGERTCPAHMALVPFLVGVIRSCASNQRELKDHRHESLDADVGAPLRASEQPGPEQYALECDLADKRRAWLYALMKEDNEAVIYLRALGAGWSSEEIRARLGFDATKLDAIQTRIRRRTRTLKGMEK